MIKEENKMPIVNGEYFGTFSVEFTEVEIYYGINFIGTSLQISKSFLVLHLPDTRHLKYCAGR